MRTRSPPLSSEAPKRRRGRVGSRANDASLGVRHVDVCAAERSLVANRVDDEVVDEEDGQRSQAEDDDGLSRERRQLEA
jgi:hypothetical protein